MSPTLGLTAAASRSFTGLFVLFLSLLVWSPIPIGSNRTWSQSLLAAAALMLAGMWALSYARIPFAIPDVLRGCRLPMLLLVGWVLFAALQLVPVPAQLLGESGLRPGGFESPPAGVDVLEFGFVSIDSDATLGGLLFQAGLVALLFLTVMLTTSRKRLAILLYVLVAVGFVEAFYGLVLVFAGDNGALWNPGYIPTNVSGTYVNQNHFAGLMELTIPVAMGLVIAGQSSSLNPHRRAKPMRWLMNSLSDERFIPAFAIAVMTAALVMTTSRGGVASLALAAVAGFVLAFWRRDVRRSGLRASIVIVCLLIIPVSWFNAGGFFEKLHATGFESDRGDLREVSYRMFREHPVMGTGVGTYRWAFPAYKDDRFGSGFYEHAHNDFLEILGEQGVVGFLLVFGAIAIVLSRTAKALVCRRDPLIRGSLFASIVGCVSLLIHGLVDFNLQIPANVAYFFVLLGIGLVASQIEERDGHG